MDVKKTIKIFYQRSTAVKNIIFFLFICLSQNSSYAMHQQETGEENHQRSTQLLRLEQTAADVCSAIDLKDKKTHILFLCTGNSCRSQMAEGWTRHLGDDIAEVNSAGIKAHGLNPNAVKVMKELGVDITNQESKVVDSTMIQWASLIVTVCGNADESCPIFPITTKKIHWSIKDPASVIGQEDEVIKHFQATRDEIYQRVFELLNDLRASK